MCPEEAELAIVDRDGCRIMLKRGTPAFNRDRCGADMEFYDLFIHCDSMPAFDASTPSFKASSPSAWDRSSRGGIRLFPAPTSTGTRFILPARSEGPPGQMSRAGANCGGGMI